MAWTAGNRATWFHRSRRQGVLRSDQAIPSHTVAYRRMERVKIGSDDITDRSRRKGKHVVKALAGLEPGLAAAFGAGDNPSRQVHRDERI